MAANFKGLAEALGLTLDNIAPLPARSVALDQAGGLVAARNLHSGADAPSSTISMKDGFALKASESSGATRENPARLTVRGTLAAGGAEGRELEPGQAWRILTGASMPPGADAVVAREFCRDLGEGLEMDLPVETGRNVLAQGSDVALGELVAPQGARLTPGRIGLLAAAGHAAVLVHPRPRISFMASGDEVVLPGFELSRGKVYASNLLTLNAWCGQYGLETDLNLVPDQRRAIEQGITRAAERGDALVTIGGAWMSARDLMVPVLESLGWRKLYHRVRIGPGKAVGFGLLDNMPVFVLPGGPPSNLMAFLQLALPGLMRLAGWQEHPLSTGLVPLQSALRGQEDWTQFIYGRLVQGGDGPEFQPLEMASRLKRIAGAQAIAAIPEGRTELKAGSLIQVQLLA